MQAVADVKFQTSLRIEPVVVEEDKLQERIGPALEAVDTTMSSFDDEDFDLEHLDIGTNEVEEDVGVTKDDIEEAPVGRFVNKIMLDAIKRGASDIHFEPYEDHIAIRFRIDGILKEILRQDSKIASVLISRIKIISGVDISERRLPQDGRVSLS